MLPWLRIIPIGGAGAAVLILVLALSPPREPRHGVSPEMALARGPLMDKSEHPEWPQLLMQAAFRRAGEILRLRDLPDTPTLMAPVMLPHERAVIAAAPPAPPPPDSGVESAAKALDVAKKADAPAPSALDAQPMKTAKLANVDDVKAATDAVKPTAPTAIDIVKTPAAEPAPEPAAAEMKVAVLPQERPATDPDPDATGSIGDGDDATIPVDIGEMSSNELPIVLPRERPPIMRIIKRERSSYLAPRKRAPRRVRVAVRRAKAAKPSNVQPASEVNLFEALFDNGKGNQRVPAGPTQKRATAGGSRNPAYPPIVTYPVTTK
ncbi:MAG TPA: hypothetical protein VIJ67_04565 [Pseudolabrys sp.]